MENIKLFELVSDYDKLILLKEKNLQKYFFNNVNENDIEGEIELPLVYSENSDYAKLKELKRGYDLELERITKSLNSPEKYLLPDVLEKLYSFGLSSESKEKEKLLDLSIKKQEKRKEKYEYRLKTIDENPKLYIRFNELKSSNFSKVEDESVREELINQSNEIEELKAERKKILEKIRFNDISPKL